jgi:tRNA-Thr(GGU) m(6)t(6)A37 methyltransferase TsaA
MTDAVQLTPIAVVRTSATEPVDENWGGVESQIVFDEPYADGLQGIEQFSHVLVLFLMHQSTFDPARDLVRRPRGRDDMPEVGIFAQRAKHRPNPIGLTAVKVIARDGNVLRVRGLDAIDGTPVLDVKPYFPAFDRVDAATTPPWVDELMKGYF